MILYYIILFYIIYIIFSYYCDSFLLLSSLLFSLLFINIIINIYYIHTYVYIHIDQAHEVFYVQCHVPEPSSTNVCCTLRLAQTCVGCAGLAGDFYQFASTANRGNKIRNPCCTMVHRRRLASMSRLKLFMFLGWILGPVVVAPCQAETDGRCRRFPYVESLYMYIYTYIYIYCIYVYIYHVL